MKFALNFSGKRSLWILQCALKFFLLQYKNKDFVQKLFFWYSYRKKNKKILKFNNIDVENRKFHSCNTPIDLSNVYFVRILLSNEISIDKCPFKYFIGYKKDRKVMLLCITLPKMSRYLKKINETRYMSFLIKNTIKSGVKLVILLIKKLLANRCKMKNKSTN